VTAEFPAGPWHTAYADGGARGNPGPAGIGAVLLSPDGATLEEISEYIGRATNNQAEYRAVVAVLEAARRHRVDALRLCLDSELIVHQLNGRYRLRNEALRPHYERAKALIRGFKAFRVQHVPREANRRADGLVNRAIDRATRPERPAAPAPGPARSGSARRANPDRGSAPGLAIADLYDLLAASTVPGVAWAVAGADLNVNLLQFDRGEGIAPHVNAEVEVLLVVLAGEGVLELDGEPYPLAAGQACLISKGKERAIRSAGGPFSYLTCHRRRSGLTPAKLGGSEEL
jgi:ribonuclease HI/mannose-6-phosphate isomerase-like protein (cupin superfamily)